jgi:hypothetical protein
MRLRLVTVLLAASLTLPSVFHAEVVGVRYAEGLVHGFLALRTLDGETLAVGDLIQRTRGHRVTTRLVFHFQDGSVHDETVVFSQRGSFRLISDRLVQKGPSFPKPMDVSVDGRSGQVTVRYEDDEGQEKVVSERLRLPSDTSNGMLLALLKNIRPETARTTLSMVAATPKPRLVKLHISPAGEDSFSLGGSLRKATHYVVKIEIGGVAGLVAPLVGKQPEDTHVWILGGEAPAFVRSEGQLYQGGPVWRIDLLSPVWPKASRTPTP